MRRFPALCTAVIAMAIGVPAASAAPGTKSVSGGEVDSAHLGWETIGTENGPSELISLFRTSDGALRVGFPHGGDLEQSVIAPNGKPALPGANPIVSGWVSLTSPAFTPAPGGALRVFFGGRHTNQNTDPNRDLNVATSLDRGATWNLQPSPVTAGPGGSDYAYTAPISAVAVGPDLHPLEAWAGGAGVFVHAGLTPDTPDFDYDQPGAPKEAGITPRLATTSSGAVALAWVTGRPPGLHVQRVDPETGAPGGVRMDFPNLVTGTGLNSMLARAPLVGRSVFGGFFSAYRGGGAASDTVRVWGVGQPHSTEFLAHRRGVLVRAVALDGDKSGHLWLAYVVSDNGKLRLSTERSDAKSAKVALFGTRVIGNLPHGTAQVIDLEVSAQPDRLDVLVTALVNGHYVTYSTQARPGLTLSDHVSSGPPGPARTVTFHVSDAGVPVAGAKVSFLGHTLTTGRDGTGSLRTNSKRGGKATASHAGYADAARRVRL